MSKRYTWLPGIKIGLFVCSTFLSGCEDTREVLGMTKVAPDEFVDYPVEKELVVPPSFDVLPEPRKEGEEQDPFPVSKPCPQSSVKTPGSKAILKKFGNTTPVVSQ